MVLFQLLYHIPPCFNSEETAWKQSEMKKKAHNHINWTEILGEFC